MISNPPSMYANRALKESSIKAASNTAEELRLNQLVSVLQDENTRLKQANEKASDELVNFQACLLLEGSEIKYEAEKKIKRLESELAFKEQERKQWQMQQAQLLEEKESEVKRKAESLVTVVKETAVVSARGTESKVPMRVLPSLGIQVLQVFFRDFHQMLLMLVAESSALTASRNESAKSTQDKLTAKTITSGVTKTSRGSKRGRVDGGPAMIECLTEITTALDCILSTAGSSHASHTSHLQDPLSVSMRALLDPLVDLSRLCMDVQSPSSDAPLAGNTPRKTPSTATRFLRTPVSAQPSTLLLHSSITLLAHCVHAYLDQQALVSPSAAGSSSALSNLAVTGRHSIPLPGRPGTDLKVGRLLFEEHKSSTHIGFDSPASRLSTPALAVSGSVNSSGTSRRVDLQRVVSLAVLITRTLTHVSHVCDVAVDLLCVLTSANTAPPLDFSELIQSDSSALQTSTTQRNDLSDNCNWPVILKNILKSGGGERSVKLIGLLGSIVVDKSTFRLFRSVQTSGGTRRSFLQQLCSFTALDNIAIVAEENVSVMARGASTRAPCVAMNLRVRVVTLVLNLVQRFKEDAMLLILNVDKDSRHSDTASHDLDTPSTAMRGTFRLGDSATRGASMGGTSTNKAKKDFLSDLSLYKDVNCDILRFLLDVWLDAIRVLDLAGSSASSLDSVEEQAVEVCRVCHVLFTEFTNLGGDSFRLTVLGGGLDQAMIAILLRYYHSDTIHVRLHDQLESMKQHLMAVFIDEN